MAWSALLSERLRRVGVRRGDRVALLCDRSPAAIAGLLAVLRAGAAPVPVDPRAPTARRAGQLAALRPAVVLAPTDISPLPAPLPHVALEPQPPPPAARGAADAVQATPDDAAYVLSTSGSTGAPKGVVVTHRGVGNYTAADRSTFGLGPGDRVLQFTSLAFDVSAEEIYPCLTAGATLVLRTEVMLDEPEAFLDGCARLGITVVHLPTSFFHELVADVERGAARVPPSLRLVVIGGEPAQPARVQAWCRAAPHVALYNAYGPTETTIATTLARLDDAAADGGCWQVPLGRALPGTAVHLLDAGLNPVPTGVLGEVYVGGAGLARGYLDRPDLTADRFVPAPWHHGERLYRTGDLARRLADGQLVFVGRADRQVKVRGHRIEPADVENRLVALPEVREAVVAARTVDGPDVELIAYVRPEGPADRTLPARLRERLADLLPASLLPTRWVLVDRLPLTPGGKVDTAALPRPTAAATATDPGAGGAPLDATEERVAEVWAGVLGLPDIGRDDHFFELGGHSLLATRVVARLRRLGFAVSLHDVFAHPRLSQLATALGAAAPPAPGPAPPGLRRASDEELQSSLSHSLGDVQSDPTRTAPVTPVPVRQP